MDRKDQFEVDYTIFREAAKTAKTKEELVGMLNEKYHFVISRCDIKNRREES